ncbi:MAG: hypothetical protein ACI9SY_000137 [Candidatus Paceibacteria bacterium]|jgi:hypothetical protein
MLIRFFSSIRNKPKEIRDQYAFWIALIATAIVAVPWFLGLPGQLASQQSGVASEPIFSSFFNDASEKLGEATDSIGSIRSSELDTLLSSSTATTTVDMRFITNDSTPAVATSTLPATPRTIRIATTSASTTQ